MAALPVRSGIAVRYCMRDYEGKTQTEISKIIGVSQVQISRLEKGALVKMQRFLED